MCIDLKDFYLGTPMNRYEYMWIKMSDIPQDIMIHMYLYLFIGVPR